MRYDFSWPPDDGAMTQIYQGKLADLPLAELIREIGDTSASGAVRLSRERAKAVVYFEKGVVVFAASNMRAHRLTEFLKRSNAVSESSLSGLPPAASDDEILIHLVNSGLIEVSAAIESKVDQVSDILRSTLLWTEGEWQFDQKIRVPSDTHVKVDSGRLLLEASRHLPASFVSSRFSSSDEPVEPGTLNGSPANLLPSEALVHKKITRVTSVSQLVAATDLTADQTRRAIYSLAICGAIKRRAWTTTRFNATSPPKAAPKTVEPEAEPVETLESFLARLEGTSDHYQILGVSRHDSSDQIKKAYHSLARRYHPDRFHQADAQLRNQIESAFARVAQAHEVLTDPSARTKYDARSPAMGRSAPNGGRLSRESRKPESENRAEASFQKGTAAVAQNQLKEAVRFFAEAASMEPHCARYRAEYGRALINDPATRRLAEIELKAAIALEPKNVSYRVVLAELYKALGLRRRAQGELERALVDDPKHVGARNLLASLKD